MTKYKIVKLDVKSEEVFELPDEARNVTYTRTDYPRREESRYEVEFIMPVEE